MTKPYSEMDEDELRAEIAAWENLIATPKGPGSASNGERNAAWLLKDTAGAWLERRKMEPQEIGFEDALVTYQLEIQHFGSNAGARAWSAWQSGNCERAVDLGSGPDLYEGWGATPRDAVNDFLKTIGRKQ